MTVSIKIICVKLLLLVFVKVFLVITLPDKNDDYYQLFRWLSNITLYMRRIFV